MSGFGYAARSGIIESSAEAVAGYHGIAFDEDLFRAMKMVEAEILKAEGLMRESEATQAKAKEEADRRAAQEAAVGNG